MEGLLQRREVVQTVWTWTVHGVRRDQGHAQYWVIADMHKDGEERCKVDGS